MRRFAVLLDAGFLKRKLGSQQNPVRVATIQRFLETLSGHPLLRDASMYRVYYYDAPPLTDNVRRPLRGGVVDFSKTELARHNGQLLRDVERLPFVSVRRGDLDFRGWQVAGRNLRTDETSIQISADDLQPVIKQTGVDMRIGLDIASLALKRHVDLLVLVTGDGDFVPAMKFARREGAQLFLVTLGHAVKDGLYEHADIVLDIDAAALIPATPQ